ncbi:MAG: hypothetical protein R3D32_12705 [Nitratireductor sp.]
MSVLTGSGFAQAQDYNNYLKFTVIGNNRLFDPRQPGEQARFTATINNYRERAQKDNACDPITVLTPFPTTNDQPPPTGCKSSSHPSPTNTQFRTRYDPETDRYEIGYLRGVQRNQRKVRLGLFRKEPGGWTANAGYSCIWTIDGNLAAENESCRAFVTDLPVGHHTVDVEVFRAGQPVLKEEALDLDLRDFLIVALGDSFGSGEGNPHTHVVRSNAVPRLPRPRPAMWFSPRCHRSLITSSFLATHLLADANPDTSFSYLNFACSGAETGQGLLEPYYGRETAFQTACAWNETSGAGKPGAGKPPADNLRDEGFFGSRNLKPFEWGRCASHKKDKPAPDDLPSQFDALKTELSCGNHPCRKPDAVLLYFGVNDIRFSDQLVKLILRCEKRPSCLLEQEAKVRSGVKQAVANFARLARRLETAGLAPEDKKHVYMMTYPNPLTRIVNGKLRLCDDTGISDGEDSNEVLGGLGRLIGIGISEAGAEWAVENILAPLNLAIAKTADAQGWSTIDVEESAQGFGYCAKRRFFHTFGDSDAKQGRVFGNWVRSCDPVTHKCAAAKQASLPTGTMHPNYFGHRAVASIIIDRLSRDLGLKFEY